MIDINLAFRSYEWGYANGDARRRNTRPTVSAPSSIDPWWFDMGDMDGASGKPRRSFAGATGAASTDKERYVYDDGFYGNSSPRYDGFGPLFESGKRDRAEGKPRLWMIRGDVPAIGPSPTSPGPVVRPAPAYVPKPNPGADPNAAPVVVNAPPVGGNPANYPVPVQRGPIPPWEWQNSPFGGVSGGSGIILYGPGYYFDLSKMVPVGKMNNQPRF